MDNTKQNALNFASLFVYLFLVIFVGIILEKNGFSVDKINLKDLIILTLASYRMTRILVFEKILKFFRDFVKSKQNYSVLITIRYIITCPWCAGVWITLLMVVLYFLVPYGKFLVYILALSGVASFLVLLANLVGLKIEEKQSEIHPHKKELK